MRKSWLVRCAAVALPLCLFAGVRDAAAAAKEKPKQVIVG